MRGVQRRPNSAPSSKVMATAQTSVQLRALSADFGADSQGSARRSSIKGRLGVVPGIGPNRRSLRRLQPTSVEFGPGSPTLGPTSPKFWATQGEGQIITLERLCSEVLYDVWSQGMQRWEAFDRQRPLTPLAFVLAALVPRLPTMYM